MTLVQLADSPEADAFGFVILPGSASTFIKFGLKGIGRGSGWLARRVSKWFFKPNKPTYRGAVARGIGAGTGISLLRDDQGEIGDAISPPYPTSRSPKQGNGRLGQYRGSRRYNNNRSYCKFCKRLYRFNRNLPHRC